MENEEECSICGVGLNQSYYIKLSCNHTYHYECLMSSFIEIKKSSSLKNKYRNRCPYCRKSCGELPVVNGLKKVIPLIHYKLSEDKPEYEERGCKGILKSGKNKGSVCNKKCQLGYEYCKRHNH